jgi:hypothetical protein
VVNEDYYPEIDFSTITLQNIPKSINHGARIKKLCLMFGLPAVTGQKDANLRLLVDFLRANGC